MKLVKLAIVSLMVLFLLTGCWDSIEVEDQYLVMLMAWDIAKDDSDQMVLTITSPTTAETAPEPYVLISVMANSVEHGLTRAQQYLFRTIELGHLRVLIVSDKFAREKGLIKFLDPLGRHPKVGREAKMIVIEGDTSQLLELKNPGSALASDYIVDLIDINANVDGAFDATFREFFECYSIEGREPALPYMTMSEDKKSFNVGGLAIFKGDKMVGAIKSDGQLHGFLLICDLARSGSVTIGNAAAGPEDNSTTFNFRRANTKIKTRVVNDEPVVDVKISLEGDITEYTSPEPMDDTRNIENVEKTLSDLMEKEFSKTVELCQKEYESDVFGFGTYFRALHSQWWNTHKWEEEFPEAKVNIDVKVEIRRIGIES